MKFTYLFIWEDGYFLWTETNISKIVKISSSTIQAKLQSHDTCIHIRNIFLEIFCNLLSDLLADGYFQLTEN